MATPRKKSTFKISDDADEDAAVSPSPEPKPKVNKVKPLAPPGRARQIVSLGPPVEKPLRTKKATKSLAQWSAANRGRTLDLFLRSQSERARSKFGHGSVFLGSETDTLVVGIPCPAFVYEYVIGQDCFPLGLITQIVAKYGVGKSALLAEIGRWFDLAGGGTVLCENETKFNPHWYRSILGNSAYNRMQLHRCNSVEDWQRHLTFSMEIMKADMTGTKEVPGPGRTIPILYGVDSIMGKMSEENQEKIFGNRGKKQAKGAKKKKSVPGEGYAQARSYPIEAGSITKYMRSVPQQFDNWPFSLVLVNHLRIQKDDAGNAERSKTGGEQVNFQESFELELKKLGGHKKRIGTSQFEGTPMILSCEKNSFGPTHRSAVVRLLWWHETDPDTGEDIQRSVWDWDWATVHLLNNLLNGDVSTYYKSRLKDRGVHLEVIRSGDSDNAAWSRSAGVSKNNPVSWSELGALIRQNTELLDTLRSALGIARRPFLAGDYVSQISKMSEDMP
jgi:hypothetical protein